MNNRPIIIVWGEPNSIFSEIFLKTIKKYKNKKPIILIGSFKLFKDQIKKLKIKLNYKSFNLIDKNLNNLLINKINFLNVEYKYKKPFEKISSNSNKYIMNCFILAFKIIKQQKIAGLINGPISKKYFLQKKFKGITEFISDHYKLDKYAMLIFNKSLSVLPVTTHLPIEKVAKNLNKSSIISKSLLVNAFYRDFLFKKPKIAVCGLNPHCENFFKKISEEKKIINPAIKFLKQKKISIEGPFPADTIFLNNLRKKYDVIIGMYHDQVLTPIKSIHAFKAINITLGLPFIRISPDHGPNFKMIGKNSSSPESLLEAIKFLDKKK